MEMRSILFMRVLAAILLTLFGGGVLGFNLFYVLFSWWTVQLSFFVISLFHSGATFMGTMISVGQHSIEIIPACVAASAYLLLALLILLTQGISFRKGMTLFLLGSVLILLANVARIEVLVALLVKGGKNYFETLHLFLWTVVSSMYVAGVWLFLCWRYKVRSIPVYSDLVALKKLLHK